MLDFLRILVAAMLVMHGAAHILWFLASWTSVPTGVGDGPWILPGNVTIKSTIGRILGLLALIVMVVFVFAAMMLVAGLANWRSVANIGVFLSYGAVVPWLRQAPGGWGLTSVGANIVLMFLLALPVSVELSA